MPSRSINRRQLIFAAAAATAAVRRPASAEGPGLPVGVAAASYNLRLAQEPAAREPLGFLKLCRERGAAGVQTSIPSGADPAAIRRYLDETGMWLEGSVRLPRDAGEVDRFEADVLAARRCGAEVLRTVLTGARRYEAFSSPAEFKVFREQAEKSVQLAEPVAARHKLPLAIENHKDLRAEEQVALLKRISSEFVGATLDTGNSLALLEAPEETAAALAPWTYSVHLKDMAVDECPEGFLLSEIPFGQGFLPLQALVDQVRKHRPRARFHVEMITRDPLVVPCRSNQYWTTLGEVPAPALARLLSLVRRHKEGRPLPGTAALSPAERVAREDENVRRCIEYARTRLKTS
jgi:sugar phosphate isomerase/epimerase